MLGIANVGDAKSRLKQAHIGTTDVWSPANRRSYATAIVNEAGLYKVIFQSRKPQAERFTDWIAEEVIPSIRTGVD